MKKRFVRILLCVAFIAIACNTLSFAERPKNRPAVKQGSLQKTTATNQFTLTGNNWAFEMTNYGPYAQDISGKFPNAGGAGGEFPRGTGTYIIFAAGFQVGALVDGIPKVSMIDFDSEFQPGALEKTDPYDINEVPRPTDKGAAINKLFALNKDGSDGTPVGSNGDAMDDFSNWPKQYGAPVDKVGNPLVIGDLMSWCVYNDMDPELHRLPDDSQKDPLGLEVQQASIQVNITGYSDVFFMYYKIINKGTQNLSDVYTAAWFDPDVDKSSNDLIATDSLTSMAFTYNDDNTDPVSLGGSAFGADFFQGPVVPGEATDTAKYLELTPDGFVQRIVPGKKTLGLSSTIRYINVRGAEGDPDNDKELYNLMQGLEKNGNPKPSRFAYPVDPLTNWSARDPRPDDKRMMLCTGPFNLAVGDTQIVVLACIGGKGTDNLDAIKNLRLTDEIAQRAYDSKFLVPQPPPSPNLTATPLDGRVVLQWDNSSELTIDKYPELANVSIPGYTGKDFAGYKVYRSLSGTVGSWTLLKQFDKNDGITEIAETTWVTINTLQQMVVRIVSIGDDKGLQYTYTDEDVVNGQSYYYAVTAYDAQASVSSGTAPRSLESVQSINAVRAVPRDATLGNSNVASTQGTATHLSGNSGGSVLVTVVDPTQVTGHTYKIMFENVLYNDSITVPPTVENKLMWKLFDVDRGAFVKFNKADDPRTDVDDSYYQINQASAADPASEKHFVTADGLLIQVYGPALDFKNFVVVSNANGPLDPYDMGCFAFNSSGFPMYEGSDSPSDDQQVGGGHWGIHTADNGSRASYNSNGDEDFVSRTTRNGANWPDIVPFDFEIRWGDSSWGNFAYTDEVSRKLPFSLWNIGIGTPDDTTDDYQMIAWINDGDEDNQFGIEASDHSISGGDNDPYTDWIYWNRPANPTPGRADYLTAEAQMINGTYNPNTATEVEVMARMVLVNWNGGSISDLTFPANMNQQLPEAGTIFRISTTKPNLPADTFSFSTSAKPAFDASLAKSRLNKHHIKVVPNPYYGFSSYDQNQFNRRVKITGLPDVCTIRIFNVAGDLVRTIDHNNASNNDRAADENPEFTSIEIWDLTSNSGLFVSSGVYFIHIDAPGIGKTKEVIPFAIIQGNIQLTVPTN